jgi:hypothetical protein
MTFGQAHVLMDLLLDKADQPYFTTQEKDKFLNIAYFNWFNSAIEKYDKDPRIAKILHPLVRESHGYFEFDGRILIHIQTAKRGHRVPYYDTTSLDDQTNFGIPLNTLRGPNYPVAKLLSVSVKYSKIEGGLINKWVECEAAKSNEFNHQYYHQNKDPFNKPTTEHPKYSLKDAVISIMPNYAFDINGNHALGGKRLIGWRQSVANYTEFAPAIEDDPETVDVDETLEAVNFASGNLSRWLCRYIVFPLASNVAGADYDENDLSKPDLWGTRNVQMGALTYRNYRRANGDNDYDYGSSASLQWGYPESVCHEIIQNAVRLMTSNIEGANYQSQAIEAEQSRSI